MLMLWFKLISQLVALALFLTGSWHGIVDHEYAQACFEILLAYGCQRG